jgi:lysophospholipase L1-like esterase
MREVRVLCLGNSLTAGHCGFMQPDRPWAAGMARHASELSGGSVRVHGRALGLTGYSTTELIEEVEAKPWLLQLQSTDLVMIMSGTNDIGRLSEESDPAAAVAAVMKNLAFLHQMCHDAGVPTIAMTILESGAAKRLSWLGTMHGALNTAIKGQFGSSDRTFVVDACRALPFDGASCLWADDGLHLTEDGYSTLGRRLAELAVDLFATVAQQQANDAALALSRRQAQVRLAEVSKAVIRTMRHSSDGITFKAPSQ